MNSYKLDLEKYAALARQAVAEGCVLLENEGQALPLRGERVAVFGRMAFHYYKSGLGSGGLVNTRYVVGILDALKACEGVQLDEKLMGIYRTGLWRILMMKVRDGVVCRGVRKRWKLRRKCWTARVATMFRLVVIGRTAGEDQDNNANAGQLLSDGDGGGYDPPCLRGE